MSDLRKFILQMYNGERPLRRENPQAGQSDYYYMDPRGEDAVIDVPTADTPNPQLNDIRQYLYDNDNHTYTELYGDYPPQQISAAQTVVPQTVVPQTTHSAIQSATQLGNQPEGEVLGQSSELAKIPSFMDDVQQNGQSLANMSNADIHRSVFNGTDCGGMTAEYADKIASLESRSMCKDNQNNYQCVNDKGSAYGYYQMQYPAMIDVGYMRKKNVWTGKDGINSWQDFLNSPQIQEKAMCAYFNRINKDFVRNNIYNKYSGHNLITDKGAYPLDDQSLKALGHRQGSAGSMQFLDSTTMDANGDFVYNFQDCYKRTNNVDRCDSLVERLKKLNE